jgi:hypothetical protein
MELDINKLLASGAMEGPARKCKPVTLGFWKRLVRLIKGNV